MADWRMGAACVGRDPEMFFPHPTNTVGVEAAQRVCAGCPVWEPCAAWALDHGLESGVWGGLSEADRRRMRRRAARERSGSVCGSAAAYQRHLRAGEVPCGACREASRLKSQERRARVRAAG